MAYLGAACAVIFLVRGFYRARWWAWVAQAIGGAVGISVGAQLWPGFGIGQVLTAAATLYAQGRPVPEAAVAAVRQAGQQIWAALPVAVSFSEADAGGDPGLVELADALSRQPKRPGAVRPETPQLSALVRTATSRTGLANGVRLGLCMAVATALALAMRQPTHSFWLPLTTAVIVRPEYASVFVRTVNRIFGTLIGALVATAVLAVLPPGLPLVAATALALGFVVLAVPKLYGLAVIGITTSALLSQSIGQADPVAPAVRLWDTFIGAAVAVIFGYLLWPEARRFPAYAQLVGGLTAAHSYLNEAVKPATRRRHWQFIRANAYRLAHQVRATAEAAALEPPPVSSLALRVIPAAIELEDTVDGITAVSSAVDAGEEPAALIVDVRCRLEHLDRTAAQWASGPLGSSGYGRSSGNR